MRSILTIALMIFAIGLQGQELQDSQFIRIDANTRLIEIPLQNMIEVGDGPEWDIYLIHLFISMRESYADKCHADSFLVTPPAGEIWIRDGHQVGPEWHYPQPTFKGFTKFLKSIVKR